MRNLFLVLLLVICVPAADCWAKGPKHNVKKGNLLYNKGEFSEALKEYESALLSAADSDIVNYNTGAALYKTEKYQTAIDYFEKALLSEDKGLEQKASYNAGNAQYKYGASRENTDLSSAISLLKQSLRHYERAMALDGKDEDARHNYEFVKKELERLQKKQEQQQQQQNKPQQDKQQPAENNQQQQENNPAQNEKQQDQQDKQNEQNKQGESEAPQPEQQKQQSNQNTQPKQEEMSEQEARMLLDNYHQEEEPKELYKEKMPVSGLSEPLKDW